MSGFVVPALALCLLILVQSGSAAKVRVRDCGSVKGKIRSIDISPCVGAPNGCVLQHGTSPTITINFIPGEKVTAVKSVVHGIVHGVPVPFSLPNPDGCKDSGLTCPLNSGAASSYSQSLEIKKIYPSLSVTIKWELQDQDGNDLACFTIPAKIKG